MSCPSVTIAICTTYLGTSPNATFIDFERLDTLLGNNAPVGPVNTGDNTVTFKAPTDPYVILQKWADHWLPLSIFFDVPVVSLGLDLYGYRGDGGAAIGDTSTLNVFSDAAINVLVGTDLYTIPSPQPVDGNVVSFAVLNPSAPILSALLSFSVGDGGVGFDTVAFATVPEPATLTLLGLGFAGIGVRRRQYIFREAQNN